MNDKITAHFKFMEQDLKTCTEYKCLIKGYSQEDIDKLMAMLRAKFPKLIISITDDRRHILVERK